MRELKKKIQEINFQILQSVYRKETELLIQLLEEHRRYFKINRYYRNTADIKKEREFTLINLAI